MLAESIRYHIGLAPRGTLSDDRTRRVMLIGDGLSARPDMNLRGELIGSVQLSNPYDLTDYHYPTERGMRQ